MNNFVKTNIDRKKDRAKAEMPGVPGPYFNWTNSRTNMGNVPQVDDIFYERCFAPPGHYPMHLQQQFHQRLHAGSMGPPMPDCHMTPMPYSMPYLHHCEDNDVTAPSSLPYYPKSYSNVNCVPRGFAPKYPNDPSKQTDDKYTSLPVANDFNAKDAEKRRFSDPGINPIDDSENSSGRSSAHTVDDGKNSKLHALVEQVNYLKDRYNLLYKELQETKMELNVLKEHTSKCCYEPGSLTEIIKQLRDTVKVREDALITRVWHMIEEKNFNNIQLKEAISEKIKSDERLLELGKQLKTVNVVAETGNETLKHFDDNRSALETKELIKYEQEIIQLRRDLQQAKADKEAAESKNITFQHLNAKFASGLSPGQLSDTISPSSSTKKLSTFTSLSASTSTTSSDDGSKGSDSPVENHSVSTYTISSGPITNL